MQLENLNSGGFPPDTNPNDYPNPGSPNNPAAPGTEPDPSGIPGDTPERRAPWEPQPPMPPESPDFKALNEERKKALEREEDFLMDEVAGEGFAGEFLPQNVQSDIESALEDDERLPN